MTDEAYGRGYWQYADKKEDELLKTIQRADLGSYLQPVFDRYSGKSLDGTLSAPEVLRLHNRIEEWQESGLNVREYQLILRDLKKRKLIQKREELDIWMLAAFSMYYRDVLSRSEPVLMEIAKERYQKSFEDAKSVTGKGEESPPTSIKELMQDENPSIGRTIEKQLWIEAQYRKNILLSQFQASALTGEEPDLNSAVNQERLGKAERALLAPSQKTKTEPNGHHGIIDKQMTFITGYTVLQAFEDAGVKKYKFIAVIDERTTHACHALNGKIFDIKDAKLGVNVPPISVDQDGLPIPHPCRSMIRAES